MKKLFLLIASAFLGIMGAQAQNDTIMTVLELEQTCSTGSLYVCTNKYSRVVVYSDCDNLYWHVNGATFSDNPMIFDSHTSYSFWGEYHGCGIGFSYGIYFTDPSVPNETTTELWKHQHEAITLEPLGVDSLEMYDFVWNTGATSTTIEVTEPGIYTCGISDMCATATRTFIVKDNVEVYRATVDLASGLNKVTWQTTPAQAQYISQVKVERDGFVVGTVPYEDRQFTDNIGSENAARNYRLTGITSEGDECPIPSHQLGTLHVDFSPNASNPNKLNMAWTAPYIEEGAPLTVTYFRICKYDPATSEVTVVDQIGANNTIGSYNVDLFDGGYATVAAVFSEGKDYEELSFSNMTEDILAVGENAGNQIRIYPNPSNGRFTAEGTGTMHISNVLGQEIMTKEINGKETIELPQGLYFVQLNGATRKIVVE